MARTGLNMPCVAGQLWLTSRSFLSRPMALYLLAKSVTVCEFVN